MALPTHENAPRPPLQWRHGRRRTPHPPPHSRWWSERRTSAPTRDTVRRLPPTPTPLHSTYDARQKRRRRMRVPPSYRGDHSSHQSRCMTSHSHSKAVGRHFAWPPVPPRCAAAPVSMGRTTPTGTPVRLLLHSTPLPPHRGNAWALRKAGSRGGAPPRHPTDTRKMSRRRMGEIPPDRSARLRCGGEGPWRCPSPPRTHTPRYHHTRHRRYAAMAVQRGQNAAPPPPRRLPP